VAPHSYWVRVAGLLLSIGCCLAVARASFVLFERPAMRFIRAVSQSRRRVAAVADVA